MGEHDTCGDVSQIIRVLETSGQDFAEFVDEVGRSEDLSIYYVLIMWEYIDFECRWWETMLQVPL